MAGKVCGAVRGVLRAIVIALAAISFPAFAGEGSEFDPATGYRIARYRTPVPEDVPGGTRISAPDVGPLIENENAVLIDVMGAEGAGPDPVTGVWRLSKPRRNIPGSVWLADVGQGVLTADRDRYYRDNLERLTAGDKARTIIIYCQADCWMSWNAVRRAASYGYTKVYWFAEGTDGWRDWDGAFEAATPVPVAAAAAAPQH
jgi:PQQ-dependent catabolism-associated CXXCW motif protein